MMANGRRSPAAPLAILSHQPNARAGPSDDSDASSILKSGEVGGPANAVNVDACAIHDVRALEALVDLLSNANRRKAFRPNPKQISLYRRPVNE
jgi:hypothetical protein